MTPPLHTPSAYRALIEEFAYPLGWDPLLLEAQVWVESADRPWAWNPEPAYRYLWNVRTRRPFRLLTPAEAASKTPPADFPFLVGDRDQEWWGQQASWGLLQVMGAVAREAGFAGGYLTELCDPRVNLFYATTRLQALLGITGSVDAALASYNGGLDGNTRPPYRQADYVQKVRGAELFLRGGGGGDRRA